MAGKIYAVNYKLTGDTGDLSSKLATASEAAKTLEGHIADIQSKVNGLAAKGTNFEMLIKSLNNLSSINRNFEAPKLSNETLNLWKHELERLEVPLENQIDKMKTIFRNGIKTMTKDISENIKIDLNGNFNDKAEDIKKTANAIAKLAKYADKVKDESLIVNIEDKNALTRLTNLWDLVKKLRMETTNVMEVNIQVKNGRNAVSTAYRNLKAWTDEVKKLYETIGTAAKGKPIEVAVQPVSAPKAEPVPVTGELTKIINDIVAKDPVGFTGMIENIVGMAKNAKPAKISALVEKLTNASEVIGNVKVNAIVESIAEISKNLKAIELKAQIVEAIAAPDLTIDVKARVANAETTTSSSTEKKDNITAAVGQKTHLSTDKTAEAVALGNKKAMNEMTKAKAKAISKTWGSFLASQESMMHPFSHALGGRKPAQDLLDKLSRKVYLRAAKYSQEYGYDPQDAMMAALHDVEAIQDRLEKWGHQRASRQDSRQSRRQRLAPKWDKMMGSRNELQMLWESMYGRAEANSRMAAMSGRFNEMRNKYGLSSATSEMNRLYREEIQIAQRASAEKTKINKKRAKEQQEIEKNVERQRLRSERARQAEERRQEREQDRTRKQVADSRMRDLEREAKARQAEERRQERARETAVNKARREAERIQRMNEKALNTSRKKGIFATFGNFGPGTSTPMAVDMAKGMGMMYAVDGLMSMVSGAFTQVSEYQNIMKTVGAILKTTDKGSNFAGRFSGMESAIRRVGRETKFTAPEVAGAGKFMAMAGLNIEDINSAISPVANLALVGDNDLTETADKMTNIMTSFGLLKGVSEAQKKINMVRASDIMTNTFSRSNTNLLQLAEAMQYAGPMSHLSGTSLEDVAAMVGIMGNAGIQASMAGTTTRMMYQNIMKPNKNQLAEWERLGVKRTDSNGLVRNIFDILKDLRAKITGNDNVNAPLTETQRKAMAVEVMHLFRTTAGAGTGALIENLGEAISLAETNRAANGVAEKIANEKKNTIVGLWAQVTSAFTDQSVNAVTEFQDQIKKILIEVRDWLGSKEAAETLKNIYDTAKSILEIFRMVSKAWMWIINNFNGVLAAFVKFQFAMQQIGYFFGAFKQVMGVANAFRNTLLGLAGAMGAANAAAAGSSVVSSVSNVVGGGKIPREERFRRQFNNPALMQRAASSGRLSFGNAFRYGQSIMSFASLGAMFMGLKNMFMELILGIGKGLGMLFSPVGLAVSSLALLGTAIFTLYKDASDAKEKLSELGNSMSEQGNDLKNKRNSYYEGDSKLTGLNPIVLGYQKAEKAGQMFSLQNNKEAKQYTEDFITENGVKTWNTISDEAKKYLPNEIVDRYNGLLPGYSKRQTAMKAGVITQWQKMAIDDESVQKAMEDLREAKKNHNSSAVQSILSKFMPSNNTPRMFNLDTAKDIFNLSNPNKFYEYQYAQWQFLKIIADTITPLEEFKMAMKELSEVQLIKDPKQSHIIKLAQHFAKAQIVKGTSGEGQILFNKSGKIDWGTMAKIYNGNVAFSQAQQVETMGKLQQAMESNEQLQKSPEILSLLETYLPQIANVKPFFTPGMDTKYLHVGDKIYANQWRGAVEEWYNSGQYTGKKTFDQFFKDKKWQQKSSLRRIADWYNNKVNNSSAGNNGSPITPPSTSSDQSKYGSKYQHNGRPTQIIFDIDTLCRFDNTKVGMPLDQQRVVQDMGDQVSAGIEYMVRQAVAQLAIQGQSAGMEGGNLDNNV